MDIKVTYHTTLPLKGFNPKVTIVEDKQNLYFVVFIDRISGDVIASGSVQSNGYISAKRQWFTYWKINVYKGKECVYTEDFNPQGKNIFIKIDGRALGDNLAWMPYVEEFRVKHNCNVICSTFFNELFEDEYSDIMFAAPNTQIANIYAQYYVGSVKPDNLCYSPFPYGTQPLQNIATEILGLENTEVKPKITIPVYDYKKKNTVCISEFASHNKKEWKGKWQLIVDFLKYSGYEVMVISKEPTKLKGVTDKTGNLPLSDRIIDLKNCQFFIGVSSGLAWLSWAVDTHVFLISDYTPSNHEFKSGCTRIYSDKCRKVIIDEHMQENNIPEQQVMDAISKYISKKKSVKELNINSQEKHLQQA